MLRFLAEWGQASIPEIPHGATDELTASALIAEMLDFGLLVETKGVSPTTGRTRPVLMLTDEGQKWAKRRGHRTDKKVNPRDLTGSYFVALGKGGRFLHFGRVVRHDAAQMCILNTFEPGFLEKPPVRLVWQLDQMHGWHFYDHGAPAHLHALQTLGAEMRKAAA
ncbi:MAG: hypothetical protein Q7J50_20015 [Hydrogenophaga sp.]|nr:hypothetical protein [Hydrogenophaga sp.]